MTGLAGCQATWKTSALPVRLDEPEQVDMVTAAPTAISTSEAGRGDWYGDGLGAD
jgi:hypothetical protein